jgi:hypothetical protein
MSVILIPTVQIADANDPTSFLVINASDYNPREHRLFGEPEPAAASDELLSCVELGESGEVPETAPVETAKDGDIVTPFVSALLAQKAADVLIGIADLTDPILLDALKAAETSGKKRVSVVAAIEARLTAIAQ